MTDGLKSASLTLLFTLRSMGNQLVSVGQQECFDQAGIELDLQLYARCSIYLIESVKLGELIGNLFVGFILCPAEIY